MNDRFEGKHKTLALAVYSDVSLAQARELCADARKVLRSGVDPNQAQASAPTKGREVDPNTFEALALQWLAKMEASRTADTQAKVQGCLDPRCQDEDEAGTHGAARHPGCRHLTWPSCSDRPWQIGVSQFAHGRRVHER